MSPEIEFQPVGPILQSYFSCRLPRLHRLAESIPGLLERLQIRALITLSVAWDVGTFGNWTFREMPFCRCLWDNPLNFLKLWFQFYSLSRSSYSYFLRTVDVWATSTLYNIIHDLCYTMYMFWVQKRRMMSSLNVYQRAVYNILDRVTWLDVSCVSCWIYNG